MGVRTDDGYRLELFYPAGDGDLEIEITGNGVKRTLFLRPSQAERLIDEMRLLLGPTSASDDQQTEDAIWDALEEGVEVEDGTGWHLGASVKRSPHKFLEELRRHGYDVVARRASA